MEKLSTSAYAKKVGISQQAVSKSIKLGKIKRLKGVESVDEIQSAGTKRKIYVINYNPDYEHEKPIDE